MESLLTNKECDIKQVIKRGFAQQKLVSEGVKCKDVCAHLVETFELKDVVEVEPQMAEKPDLDSEKSNTQDAEKTKKKPEPAEPPAKRAKVQHEPSKNEGASKRAIERGVGR